MTQSAFSKRVAQIEQQLGALLFDRIGSAVRLTEAGNSLAYRANLILQQVENTERAIRNLNGEIRGNLSLATSHQTDFWRFPHVLSRYTAKNPKVSLDLHFMDSEVAHERIIHGELEMAIITLAPRAVDR